MSLASIGHLVDALRRPERLQGLDLGAWDVLIRQARRADLLARIAAQAHASGTWDAIATQPRRHLASALQLAHRQQTELRHEVGQIERALRPTGLPLVLLKGAAYAMANLSVATGRMVADVDILVPRARLADVESALMMAGWVSTNRNEYDQRYYRRWMHELPPLKHMSRGTVLDVHHAIMPLTARLKPATDDLLALARPLDGHARVRVLCRTDMVLHSAAHLFHEGEFGLGLRGLVDLDALLSEFASTPGFWSELLQRARVLQLEWPLLQALRYAAMLLQTAVPPDVVPQLSARLGRAESGLRQSGMDALFLRALRPDHASTSDAWTPLARGLLYVRGHWLRMPPWMLTRHLLRKLLLAAGTGAARGPQQVNRTPQDNEA